MLTLKSLRAHFHLALRLKKGEKKHTDGNMFDFDLFAPDNAVGISVIAGVVS